MKNDKLNFNEEHIKKLLDTFLYCNERLVKRKDFFLRRFIEKFKLFELGIKKTSFNWIAFLFPKTYTAYRRLWKQFFIALFVSVIAGVFATIIAIGATVAYNNDKLSYSTSKFLINFVSPSLFIIIYATLAFFYALKADYWIYRKFRHLYNITEKLSSDEKLEIMCKAGCSPTVISTVVAAIIILSTIVLILFELLDHLSYKTAELVMELLILGLIPGLLYSIYWFILWISSLGEEKQSESKNLNKKRMDSRT